jgi:type I restriction enzyme S subunit
MSTATLHSEKKKALNPQLRFPGFEGEFKQTKFGKLYSFQTTNSLSRDKLNYEGGNVYNIHYGDIHTKFKSHFYLRNENVPNINEDVDLSKIKEDLYCKTGDIIIADASEDYADIGKSIELIDIDNVKLLAGLHTLLARPMSDKTFVGFTSYLLKSTPLRKQIMTIAQGSKVLSLSTGRVSNLELNIPTLPEQQKIASFLIAVDEKIQQLSRKKELLEQYKKGTMQQLFSGKLRFKDENGDDYADWEEKKLGEVCKKIQDGNYGASYPKADEFIETGIPFLTSKALGNGGTIISSKIDYISLEKHKQLKKAHLKLNDVLFTNRGSNVGAIGFVDESISHGNIGPQLTLLRTNQEIIDSGFLFHSMNSFGVKKQVSSQDSGSAMNFFGIGVTSKFKIQVPSLPEQQKIANFLSSIDTKIESTRQQITQTQSFKKGLLQRMFV